jgi:hypothetical protein
MKVSLEIDGPTEETLDKIKNQSKNVRKTIHSTFHFMGHDLKKKIAADIKDTTNKTGRVYTVRGSKSKGLYLIFDPITATVINIYRGRRRRHQSSAPGETHADLTGNLRKSLGWKVSGKKLQIGYGAGAPDYAEIEFGYGKVEARPSIGNRVEGVTFETFFEMDLEKRDRK